MWKSIIILALSVLTGLSSEWNFNEWKGALPEGWSFEGADIHGKPALGAKVAWDHLIYQSEPGALRIDNDSPDASAKLRLTKDLEKGDYQLSFWCKGQDIVIRQPSALQYGLGLNIRNQQGDYLEYALRAHEFVYGTGTFDWKKVVHSFHNPSSQILKIDLCLLAASGTLWIDDVKLEKKQALPDEIASASVFPVEYNQKIFGMADFAVVEGLPGLLTYAFKAQHKDLAEITLQLEVPHGWSILGAAPYYGEDGPRFYAFQPENKTGTFHRPPAVMESVVCQRDGEPRLQYRITIRPLNNPWWVYLKASPQAKAEGQCHWKLLSGDWQGEEQSFVVRKLPELPAFSKKMPGWELYLSFLYSQNAPCEEVRQAYLNFWNALTIEKPATFSYFGWGKGCTKENFSALAKIFRSEVMIGGTGITPIMDWGKTAAEVEEASGNKLPRVVTREGKESPVHTLCPTHLADRNGMYWQQVFPCTFAHNMSVQQRIDYDTVAWDVEPYSWHCCCLSCRTAFADKLHLQKVPDINEIFTSLGRQWDEFRVDTHHQVILNFQRQMRQRCLKFALITNELQRLPGGQVGPNGGRVDPRLLSADEASAIHIMSYYTGTRFYDDTETHVKHLNSKFFAWNDPSEPEADYATRYHPDTISQNLVAAASLGAAGFGIYPGDNLDGRFLQAIHKTFAQLANFAEYYQHGMRNDTALNPQLCKLFQSTLEDEGKNIELSSPDSGNFRCSVHQLENRYLATFFNFDPQNRIFVTIQPPKGVPVRDPAQGLRYTGIAKNGEVIAQVPPNGWLVLEVGGNPSSLDQNLHQAGLHQEFQEMKNSISSSTRFPAFTRDNAEISWGDIDDDLFPDLILKAGDKKIYVSLQHSGTIISWKDRQSGGRDLLFHQSRGALDHFYLHPQWTRPMPMRLSHADIVDGAPEATLEYTIKPLHQAVAIYDPQEGLLIKKQIRLSKDGLSVQARITLTNQNPRQEKVPAGIRVKCFPRLGSNFAGSKFLPSIFNLNLDGNSYNATHFTSNTAYNYFPMAKKNLLHYQKVLPGKTLHTFKSPQLLLKANSEKREEILTALCDPGNTAGLYVYYSQTAVTVELLSDYVTLPCGDSLTYQYEFTWGGLNPQHNF